ncbi:MAG: bifunctional diguanylate cyclase/phosphodiesterase [Lachnospiraceae bacterium]|nr:bifunctional diguanylate cyclase/phosphodiesterase [Lachnospiraceae bacterium]
MDELKYELDLLKAKNEKLIEDERMYREICENSDCAYLYVDIYKNKVKTIGKWSNFFDFDINTVSDLDKLYDAVGEDFSLSLRDTINAEKSGKKQAFCECQKLKGRMWIKVSVTALFDDKDEITHKIITLENITKLKFQSDELTYMAYYDALTGLYNRNYFVRCLAEFVDSARENDGIVSVMMMDIDDFKKVNDSLGIVVGDEVIQQFGSYLKTLTSETVIASHLSSDVYCLAIKNPAGATSVEKIYRQIKKRLEEHFALSDGRSVTIDISVGVSEYPESADNALELINCAEIVLFKSKELGKNTIQFFDTSVLNEFIHSVEMENKLKDAVFNRNFILYYQPQYFVESKKLRGMEALIRWKDTDNQMISPASFIPIAEKNGAIIPIGGWVVEQAISQYSEWSKKYGISFIMSINVSALQCGKEDFVDNILRLIEKYEVEPSEIEIEVTESILIDDFDVVSAKLMKLREKGLRISLDDFGTGYSSLSYLKKLPIDTLKIDKSFMDTVLNDSTTKIVTESIINMIRTLGYESIAEGVEVKEQYDYLQKAGCDVIQGYLFSKPKSAEELNDMLLKEYGEIRGLL